MHVKCAFNAFTMRTSVVMRFLCAYNAFSVRAIRVMRFLCAHNASSVREIRILRVKYVFCTREIRILRVKYVFCSHKIRILHARSIPAADIDSNEIYDDSQSGGRPFSDECKKPAIVCRDQVSMRFEDSMYIQLYISLRIAALLHLLSIRMGVENPPRVTAQNLAPVLFQSGIILIPIQIRIRFQIADDAVSVIQKDRDAVLAVAGGMHDLAADAQAMQECTALLAGKDLCRCFGDRHIVKPLVS